MSDGPHRSLGMRRGWKLLSERADNRAFSPEEVWEILPVALAQDCRAEHLRDTYHKIENILANPQLSFFPDQRSEQIESLRSDPSTYPLGTVFIESVIYEIAKGRNGEDAIDQAMQSTLLDRATRGSRQVEEHFLRKSTLANATDVRRRIDAGIASLDFSEVSAAIIKPVKSNDAKIPSRRKGLDDGVEF